VLGSERLNIDMSRRFQGYKTARGEELTILKLDKSGGCVDRDEEYVISPDTVTVFRYKGSANMTSDFRSRLGKQS